MDAHNTLAEPTLEINADLCQSVADDLQSRGMGAEAETFYRAALSLAPDRAISWANRAAPVCQRGARILALRDGPDVGAGTI